MWVNPKVYASGGENGLHNHTDQDQFHLLLGGEAGFHGPRGEEKIRGMYQGVMLPSGSHIRFESAGDERLILLRVAARTEATAEHPCYNIYDKPLPSHLRENGGQVEVIRREGEFRGAAE